MYLVEYFFYAFEEIKKKLEAGAYTGDAVQDRALGKTE